MIISAYQTDHCAPLQRKLKFFSKMKINHGKFSFCWVSFKASFLLGRDEAKEMHWALEKNQFLQGSTTCKHFNDDLWPTKDLEYDVVPLLFHMNSALQKFEYF